MNFNKVISKIKNFSKKTFSVITLSLLSVALIGMVTNSAKAAEVLMEGNTEALNVTNGDTSYGDNTSALVDDVVQVQVWYHNREVPGAAVAKNTRVKVDIPTTKGKQQVITGTTTADNANTVKDTTNVNLSLDRSYLEFIPGSAKWRYNKGAMDGDTSCQTGMNFPPERCYATVPVSDDVVKNPQGLNLGNTPGCNAYHATITVQVRVRADVVSVNKYVRHKGQTSNDWKTETNAKPGDDLEYMIKFKNEGNTQLNNVAVADNLPPYNKYVENSTKLMNGVFPNGTNISSNNLTRGGIDVGNYQPGAVGYVLLQVKIDPINVFPKCGVYDVRNVGVVRPQGMNEFYNTAIVKINVECKEQPPQFKCEALAVQQLSRTSFRFTASGSAQNATITGYQFSLNGNTVQDSANNTYTLNQSQPGQYTVSVIVKTDKGNTQPTAVCTKTVTVEEEEEEPKYACDLLNLTSLGGRKVRLSVDASASNGAKILRYIYNFGDGSQPLTTDKNVVDYEYKKDGTFNSSAQVVVEVNGETKTITGNECVASVTFKPNQPPEVPEKPGKPSVPGKLPSTGAGDIVAAFFAVTIGSTVAYYVVVRKFAGL